MRAASAYHRGSHDCHRHQHRRRRVVRGLEDGRRRRHLPVRHLCQPRLRLPRRRSRVHVRRRPARAGARPGHRRASRTARSGRLRPARPACHARPGLRDVVYQVGALTACSACSAATMHHVKLHGAFSTHVAEDPAVADGVLRAVHDIDPALPLIVTRGLAARALGRRDRPPERGRGLPRARLRARRAARKARHPGRRDHRRGRGRAPRGAHGGRGQGGRDRRHADLVDPRTLCIHGDNPHAARIAAAVRAALEAAGVELAAF